MDVTNLTMFQEILKLKNCP